MRLAALWLCVSGPLPAQTVTTLFSFDGHDGVQPATGLVQGTDGNLYGTTQETIFKITPSGTLTTLSGGESMGALILATDGNFYGTSYSLNSVFKITPSGTLTTLYSFGSLPAPSGIFPAAALVQAADGNFYGTTVYGGANSCIFGGTDYGCGTIFKITPSGTLTTLYSFCSKSGCTDGETPGSALVQASNGNLYGTTPNGGANGDGTVFEITTAGTLTTLHSFCSKSGCADGEFPEAALLQATDGNLYGTTVAGGANGGGTIFKITPSGTLTTFFSSTDGPRSLVQASDGNFYGTAGDTLFKITPSGTPTTLFSFDGTDCTSPTALVQDTSGIFYGTTIYGGIDNYHFCHGPGCGTVFSLAVGLGPFVKTEPASGEVGAAISILGTDLTGASSVSFNGMAAVFSVVSSSQIAATVPAGATTGKVHVVTPSGTLSSNVSFRVAP
jgi:uncharacterized repeat protein (TIGR03803 family)